MVPHRRCCFEYASPTEIQRSGALRGSIPGVLGGFPGSSGGSGGPLVLLNLYLQPWDTPDFSIAQRFRSSGRFPEAVLGRFGLVTQYERATNRFKLVLGGGVRPITLGFPAQTGPKSGSESPAWGLDVPLSNLM